MLNLSAREFSEGHDRKNQKGAPVRYSLMEEIKFARERAVSGMNYFLQNFAHIPDDKLTWTPTPSAKSALRIGAHTALYAARFARMIETRTLPQPENLTEWLRQRNEEELEVTARTDVIKIFKAGTADLLNTLDQLTPEDVEMVLDSGQGWTLPMKQLIGLPGFHALIHAGQIDFLQTCWDDQTIYLE